MIVTMYRFGLLVGFVYPVSRAWVLWMAGADATSWLMASHILAVIFCGVIACLFMAITAHLEIKRLHSNAWERANPINSHRCRG